MLKSIIRAYTALGVGIGRFLAISRRSESRLLKARETTAWRDVRVLSTSRQLPCSDRQAALRCRDGSEVALALKLQQPTRKHLSRPGGVALCQSIADDLLS